MGKMLARTTLICSEINLKAKKISSKSKKSLRKPSQIKRMIKDITALLKAA